MGKTKEKEEKAKVKKGKDSASRNSSSSRRGLEQTITRGHPGPRQSKLTLNTGS